VASEAALVTVGGLAGGALIGWGLSRMLVTVLTGVFDPPPSRIAVPWGYLAATVTAVGVAVAVATRTATRASTTPPVEQLREL
jgi:putative ABC transport system permease protein